MSRLCREFMRRQVERNLALWLTGRTSRKRVCLCISSKEWHVTYGTKSQANDPMMSKGLKVSLESCFHAKIPCAFLCSFTSWFSWPHLRSSKEWRNREKPGQSTDTQYQISQKPYFLINSREARKKKVSFGSGALRLSHMMICWAIDIDNKKKSRSSNSVILD